MAGKSSVFEDNKAPSVDAAWLNLRQNEVKNTIESSGQVLSDLASDQEGIAMAIYASSTFYTDSGTANSYVLSAIGSRKAPTAYFEGMQIQFRAGNTNPAGASTVDVSTIGSVSLLKEDGITALDPNEIPTTSDSAFRYSVAAGAFVKKSAVQDASTSAKGIVELLTDAELAAGLDSTRAATASSIISLFNSSTDSANGTIKFPINIGGSFVEAIFQWGIAATAIDISTGGDTITLTFNEAFPNVPVAYQGGILGVAPNYAPDAFATIRDVPTTTQIQVRLDESGGVQSAKATYWALGLS